MTNRQTLTKAIQKAIDGGWDPALITNGWGMDDWRKPEVDENGDISQYDGDDSWKTLPKEALIFNHDFAKALWGEEWKSAELLPHIPPKDTYRVGTITPCWQFHLQAMVIADDPIKYLGEHLPE